MIPMLAYIYIFTKGQQDELTKTGSYCDYSYRVQIIPGTKQHLYYTTVNTRMILQ